MRDTLRRNALRLVLAGFVLVPLGLVLLVTLLGLPARVGAIALIIWGLGAGTLAFRLVKDLMALYAGDDVVPGEELQRVSGDQMLSDKPHAVWVPFLFTSSWMLIIVGLIWLALVDLQLSLIVLAVLVVLYLWWWLVQPRLRKRRSGES